MFVEYVIQKVVTLGEAFVISPSYTIDFLFVNS